MPLFDIVKNETIAVTARGVSTRSPLPRSGEGQGEGPSRNAALAVMCTLIYLDPASERARCHCSAPSAFPSDPYARPAGHGVDRSVSLAAWLRPPQASRYGTFLQNHLAGFTHDLRQRFQILDRNKCKKH